MTALISISDIHNGPDIDHCLAGFLAAKYNLSHKRFSLPELAGKPDLSAEELHQTLFEGGAAIDAAERLIAQVDVPSLLIGYSAGGTIGAMANSVVQIFESQLFVSSTRLRHLTASHFKVPSLCLFGQYDEHQPSPDWHKEALVERYEVAEFGHDFYKELPVESWAPLAEQFFELKG
ncbi:hypothetical protein [Maritalea sp. S77]|jgi:hypothetical protein|uniref:hypothetical protein n=1 Tax=Maritalea sp. S77 TaxID=3415125 RepID=UPI003C7D7D7B